MQYNIPEETFQKFYKVLRSIKWIHTKNEAKIRVFIEAVYYLARSGCQVRLLPSEYGNCFSIYQKFLYWKKFGVWNQLFDAFKEIDNEWFSVDGTIIRANQCAAGYKKCSHEDLGRSCGGFSTKILALVDALGNPVEFILCPGNEHDIVHAEEITENLKDTSVLGDKAFDSAELRESLAKRNCIAVIPSRSNSKNPVEIDKHIYKERHLVELFFNKIKCYRRIFSRFCKSSSSYLSFLHFASTLLWLK